MPNCKEYSELLPIEKRDFIGSIVHAATNDSEIFLAAQRLIKRAINKGVFEGIVINPNERETELITENIEQ